MSISLFKEFTQGMTDYIAKHNANYSVIENQINSILSLLTGQQGGVLEVPEGLKQIYDRKGIVGRDSYDFSEGTHLDEVLEVNPGAYWSGAYWRQKTSFTNLSLVGRNSETYYIYLDGTGTPALASSPQQDTIWSFYWDDDAKEVSQKQLYTGVSILFDGDDYADMLDSAAKGKEYTRVADRLEEIEQGQDVFGGYYAENPPHDGLNFKYTAGKVRNDSVIAETPAGQVALTDNATNYVEVDPADGTMSANTTGFTSGKIPLYQVVTSGEAIDTVEDQRTPAIAGTGGGGGGHTQNTDVGTTSDTFTIDMDAAGSPTGRAGLEVENGDEPNAMLKFNRETGHWQFSEDGGTSWKNLGEPDLSLGAQEFSRFVALENPPEVYYESNRGPSADYETMDLTSYLGSPQFGVKTVLLRVFFRDTSPSANTKVLFRKGGGPYSPQTAFTVWSDESADEPKPADLIIPLGDGDTVDFWVYSSGNDTATLHVFLLGYFEVIYGVGTQEKTLTQDNLNVAADTTQDFTLENFCNRGLCHYLKIQETSGNPSGTFDIHLYADAAFSILLYNAEGLIPADGAFEDWLPFWVYDSGQERKIRVRIVNHDPGQAGTYFLTLKAEQFA
ncbi:MAG: hypothetical protein JRI66_10910 [Deltaproteobacteria bacterium]|nr:hypothetical protein [Deltaproteobacteria bacterium]